MLTEVLSYLKPKDGEVFIDCTFGAGGYTRKILESCKCSVIALDRDENVEIFSNKIKEQYGNKFEFYRTKYSEVENILSGRKVNGIVLDLGVSSMQLDSADRGFSFQKNSKLDMRMGENSLSAFEIVNTFREQDIADIIYNYGDEVRAKVIAREIVLQRKQCPINTTFELADIVRKFYKSGNKKIDPATKTFQAIRIAVNDELNELRKILILSKKILQSGGRLVVVSFHSLEDRIVKEFIKKEINKGKIDKYSTSGKQFFSFELLTKKAVTPTAEEISKNPRSRSAKLRALKKC